MKSTILIAFLTLGSLTLNAQKAPFKFGTISSDDLKMTRYEKDTAAAAVILGDYGYSSINYNQNRGEWSVQFERTQRIKILKEDGYSYANFEIPLYHSASADEKLSGLKVVTHNLENGKDVEYKMKSDAVFQEVYNENVNLKKFTAPNVKVGSVIEVTYQINSDFIHYFRDWDFQSKIPTVWSEYRANIPEYFNYQQFMQGYIGLNINEHKVNPKVITLTSKERSGGGRTVQTTYSSDDIRFNENAYRWVAQDVPGLKEEPFMTTPADYISKINFELASVKFPNSPVQPMMGTWSDLNKSFLENDYFGRPISGSLFLKKITEDVTAGKTTPAEKVIAIYNYIQSNVEWNGNYRKYLETNLKKPLDDKKGSSAEINLLLVAMLQRAGFNANPVLISTRNHGFVRESLAISSQFNYVICVVEIDGGKVLLDATDRMLPMNLLPERCLNGKGFIVAQNGGGWVPLSAPKSKIFAMAELNFSADGVLKGKIDISNSTYDGYALRKQYFRKGEADYVKDFSHMHSWEIEKSSFENMTNSSADAKEKYEFTHTENFGDASVIYFNPLLHLKVDENPFRLEDRIYPVDFGKPMERSYICKISIPENFHVEEVPKPQIIAMPNNSGKFSYNASVLGNTINIVSIVSINQSLFSQLEYKGLREFYNLIVAKHAEQIVLKKKP